MSLIRKIFDLLSSREQRQFYALLGLVVLMGMIQVVGIASILPFLTLVTNPQAVQSNTLLNWVYHTLGFTDTNEFLLFVGLSVLVVFVVNNSFTALTIWATSRFAWMRNHTISQRLLRNYLQHPYPFFLNRNSADLSKNILNEVTEVVSGILEPALRFVTHATSALFIIGFLLLIDPLLSIVVAAVLGGAYLIIFRIVRRRLARTGAARFEANTRRFQITNEAFGGIKEIKVLGCETYFVNHYASPSRRYGYYMADHRVIGQVPRYALETVAFGSILIVVLYMLGTGQELTQIMPIIGLYAFAGYRLLPALQQVFTAITKMRFSVAALNALHTDLTKAQQAELKPLAAQRAVDDLPFTQSLHLQQVSYTYPEADSPVISDLNLTIFPHTSVAFVGATGSGKTTIIDIILGLLIPQQGAVLVDDIPLDQKTRAGWQKKVGYVPQHIYLADDTLAHNIAFGTPPAEIDSVRIKEVAKIANIHKFIASELPQGYDTFTGERGVRLSGGQRQRIGIARALYRDPDVLILDEATSALDNRTEESVFQAVANVARTKTVIMIAHRLSTVRNCDTIFMLEKGQIVAQGDYNTLLAESSPFQALVQANGSKA